MGDGVAMKSPDHLRRWLAESGRRWLIFDALDLVDSLAWPEGVVSLIDIIDGYRDHRAQHMVAKVVPGEGEIQVAKGDTLELSEVDQCIRWLVGRARELDPDWDPREALG